MHDSIHSLRSPDKTWTNKTRERQKPGHSNIGLGLGNKAKNRVKVRVMVRVLCSGLVLTVHRF